MCLPALPGAVESYSAPGQAGLDSWPLRPAAGERDTSVRPSVSLAGRPAGITFVRVGAKRTCAVEASQLHYICRATTKAIHGKRS